MSRSMQIAACAVMLVAAGTLGYVAHEPGVSTTPVATEHASTRATKSPVDAPMPAVALRVPTTMSEVERDRTREQRKAALPVFLEAAENSIAQARSDLLAAEHQGAPASERQRLQATLDQLLKVRDAVLTRNRDIR